MSGAAEVKQTSQPEMAHPGSYAGVQFELLSRLHMIYKERDTVQQLLQKFIDKADAVASHVSRVGEDGRFVGPFLEGCATLDRMFTRLFQVYTLLTEEDSSANPELPTVAHGVIAYPSPHSGAEVPPPDATHSCLSGPPPRLNAPPSASPSANYEATERHPSC